MTAKQEVVGQVREALQSFWDCYESGDVEFFDCFSGDASLFAAPGANRIDGLQEYREKFEPELGKRKRAMQVFDLEIRTTGKDWALVTYHCRIRIEAVSGDHRMTLLFVQGGDGRFEIAHFHVSPIAQPESPVRASSEDLLEEITEIEEQV